MTTGTFDLAIWVTLIVIYIELCLINGKLKKPSGK